MSLSSSKKTGIILFLLISLVFNLSLLYQLSIQHQIHANEDSLTKKFPLISKRIFVEDQNDILVNFVDLRKKLYEYRENQVVPLGIYFEYLPSGVSIGVNEKEDYLLASLLKVPMIMAIYHNINTGELDRTKMLTITPEDLDNRFGDLWQKGAGGQISIDEAIKLVLTNSDNTAKNVLLRAMSVKDLADVFDYLDIPKESEEDGPVVTPKNYSSILRSLYLSSYLPKDQSNEILEIMTHSVHKDRIRAGVPEEVAVAHKIGVYEKVGQETSDIYTDCGIVYVPKRPYILCVMTRSSLDEAKLNISTVSKIVYEYVSSVNK